MTGAGESGVIVNSGSGYVFTGSCRGAGKNLVSGKQQAAVFDGDARDIRIDWSFDPNPDDAATQTVGVEVKSAKVDNITVQGTAYSIATPIIDPYSMDSVNNDGLKFYDLKTGKWATFNVQVQSGAIQRAPYTCLLYTSDAADE